MKETKSSQAFTLIELLVVIAIIAILAAVLFPVFATAREKARQTTCTSNAKQIMIAVLQYNQDYDEMYPPNYTYSGSMPLTYWFQLLMPYVKSQGIFLCPSDTNPVAQAAVSYSVSYMDNIVLGGNGNPNNVLVAPYYPVPKVVSTSTTVYMCEGGAQAGTGVGSANNTTTDTSTVKEGAYILQDPANPWSQCSVSGVACAASSASNAVAWAGPAARHNKMAVVGFADGHAKALLPSLWYYNNTPYLNPTIGGN